MKMEPQLVVTTSEEERIEKLGKYFEDFLSNWFGMLVVGVRGTPGVRRQLALTLLKYGAVALLGDTDEAMKESDEKTADRCIAVAREMLEVIERHVHS